MTSSDSAASGSNASVLVKQTISVAAPPERAFRVFTHKLGSWWPLNSHKIGKVPAVDAVIEPFVGGRWFERGNDGSECNWGHVLAWDPPRALILSWEISVNWQPDPSIRSEVEVRFLPEGSGTRVELEHRKLEVYGDASQQVRSIFDSPGGWPGLLRGFGEYLASAAAQSV